MHKGKDGLTMVKVYTDCPVEYTASILSNKWKCLIMRDLIDGTKRFNELNRSIIGISAKVLTENLRELENLCRSTSKGRIFSKFKRKRFNSNNKFNERIWK